VFALIIFFLVRLLTTRAIWTSSGDLQPVFSMVSTPNQNERRAANGTAQRRSQSVLLVVIAFVMQP